MLIRITRSVFTVATVLLLVGGLVIVGIQAVALVVGRGDWMTAVSESLEPPTFIAASVAGILAFALSYTRPAVGEGGADTQHLPD